VYLLSLFDDTADAERITAGSTIFREGDVADFMYVILEGEVGIGRGEEHYRTLGQGELFGELALIDDEPRSADAVARTDCVLVPVDERRFLFLVHETPMFAMHVMRVIAQRLRN
jgi:CRP-like cAMP-binding protein